jgi:hypothetical protein
METKTVTVRTTRDAGLLLVVRLDGVRLQLDGEGTGKKDMKRNAVHVIDYFVRGQTGGRYSVAITSPVESRLSRSGTLDADQMDVGHAYFFVA